MDFTRRTFFKQAGAAVGLAITAPLEDVSNIANGAWEAESLQQSCQTLFDVATQFQGIQAGQTLATIPNLIAPQQALTEINNGIDHIMNDHVALPQEVADILTEMMLPSIINPDITVPSISVQTLGSQAPQLPTHRKTYTYFVVNREFQETDGTYANAVVFNFETDATSNEITLRLTTASMLDSSAVVTSNPDINECDYNNNPHPDLSSVTVNLTFNNQGQLLPEKSAIIAPQELVDAYAQRNGLSGEDHSEQLNQYFLAHKNRGFINDFSLENLLDRLTSLTSPIVNFGYRNPDNWIVIGKGSARPINWEGGISQESHSYRYALANKIIAEMREQRVSQ